MRRRARRWGWCVVLALALCLVLATHAGAQVRRPAQNAWDTLAFSSPRLSAADVVDPIDGSWGQLDQSVRGSWTAFLQGRQGQWSASINRRNGRLELAEGAGIPWVPGQGNRLAARDIASFLQGRAEPDLPALEGIARAFVAQVGALLGRDGVSLALNQGRSGNPGGYLWDVDFDVLAGGMPIEGARVVFRINNGNLVQFGTENLPAPGTPVPSFGISREQALATVSAALGGLSDTTDTFLDVGSQHLLPGHPALAQGPEDFQFGQGYELIAVWQFVLTRQGFAGTWRARVDAVSGDLLELKDINAYASVTGGVYPNSYSFANETVMAMPFAYVKNTSDVVQATSNTGGLYTWTGVTTWKSLLDGPTVRIADTCGAISLTVNPANGNLAFGASSGTDCITPGIGGAGNTHSSRMQFYMVNRAKEKARSWLSPNTWLDTQQTTVNVNQNATCNAFWTGALTGTLNFYRSGGGCGNTGEIAGVSLHELGHGLDANDGNGSSPDGGTGEVYGDTHALLQLHDSCGGWGFDSAGYNCTGYGDRCNSCTGVRDIDYAKHELNQPHTVDNYTRIRCGGASCVGPCGRECHCESEVATEAIWDFAARDLPSPGTSAAWAVLERLWYLSRPTATAAFSCNTATWTSDGCGAGSLWKVMRARDDDDGNLNNGTPHSCYLWAAFNRHGIGCSTDLGYNTCFRGVTAPAAPTLAATAGTNQVNLSWNNVGGAFVYDVYRNEAGCDKGFTKLANNVAGTSYADSAVAPCTTYYYTVIAHLSGNEAADSAPSNCASARPHALGALPSLNAPAASVGHNGIDLSWSAVGGATSYNVYRATVSGGPYTLIGSPATTSYTDTTPSLGIAYYYVVRALDSNCETGDSNQQPFTLTSASGSVCDLPPSFAGASSVTTPNTASCGLQLSWGAATAPCGGALRYNVYRSTSSPFTPSQSNRMAELLSGTSYTDNEGLASATPYYYIVRAVDLSNGAEDSNTATVAGAPYGTLTADQQQYYNDFELNATGWTTGAWSGVATSWRGRQQCGPGSPATYIYRYGGGTSGGRCTNDYGINNHSYAYPPQLTIPAGAKNVRLSFSHRWQAEDTWDGAYLRIYATPSTSLQWIYPSAFISGGYNSNLQSNPAWSGDSGASYTSTVVDLDKACDMIGGQTGGCAGRTIRVYFSFYSDANTTFDGWFIDNVRIAADVPVACTAVPGDVSALTTTCYQTQNLVEWYNPGVGGGVYGSTRVNYRSGASPSAPTGPTDGSATVLIDKYGTASSHDSTTQSSLTNGYTYYYGAWANTDNTPPAPPTGVWSGPGRTVASAPYGTITGRIVWAYATGASSLVEPRMFPGIGVVAVSNDRFLHAMAPGSAGGNWPASWKPAPMNGPAQGPATVLPVSVGTATRVVFTGSQDGTVYCFNADTGAECSTWIARPKLGDMIAAQPMPMHTSYGGSWNLLLVGTRNATGANKLCALNMSNGTQAWCFDNSAGQGGDGKAVGIISGAAFVDAAFTDPDPGHSGWKRVFFASRRRGGGSSNTLWCVHFNATTAALRWGKDLGDIDGAVTSNWTARQLLVGTNAGSVVAVDPDAPTANDPNPPVVWTRALGDGAVKGMVMYDPSRSRLYLSTSTKVWGIPASGATGSDWSVTSPTLYSPARPLWLYNSNYVLVGACADAGCSNGLLVQLDSSTSWASGTKTLQITSSSWLGGVTVNRDVSPMTAHFGSGAGRVYTVQVPLP